MKSQDVYGEPIIIKRKNGFDIVSHPILPDEERARRMKMIEEAAAAMIIAQDKLNRKKVLECRSNPSTPKVI